MYQWWITSFIICLAPRAGKMNQILHCDWLPEQARWSYLARSGLPAVSCKKQFPRKPYNKSLNDQVCSVRMAGYRPCSFFLKFMDLDSVLVHKHTIKELGQYPAILTSHLVDNPYLQTIIHFIGEQGKHIAYCFKLPLLLVQLFAW